MNRRIWSIALLMLMLSGNAFGADLTPSFNLAEQTTAYQTMLMEQQRLFSTKKTFDLLENRMNSQLSSLRELTYYFGTDTLAAQFELRLNAEMARPNYDYLETVINSNLAMTRSTMLLALRNLYTGLYAAQRDYEIGLDLYELEKSRFLANQKRYEQGLISKIEYDESQLDWELAGLESRERQMAYEEMLMTFNDFVNENDLRKSYSLHEEVMAKPQAPYDPLLWEETVDTRLDLLLLVEEIGLKNTEVSIYESRGGSYLIYPKIEYRYKLLTREVELLNLEYDDADTTERIELEKLSNSIDSEYRSLMTMTRNYDNQIQNLENLKLQNELGYLSDQMYAEIEIGIRQYEMAYQLSIQNFNTKVMEYYFMSTTGLLAEGGY